MKKIVLLLVSLMLCLCLCACDGNDAVTTNISSHLHVERHYQDSGDLFCIIETNIDTGTVISTYFYWKYDAHGRRTLDSTERITVDGSGTVVAHVCTPGHS